MATRQKHELALVVLLLAEIVYLTVTLDTQPLSRLPSIWATLVGWAPQYLRLAISITAPRSSARAPASCSGYGTSGRPVPGTRLLDPKRPFAVLPSFRRPRRQG